MVLRMYNAQEVDETSSPYLYNMVKELAARAQLPMPRSTSSTRPAQRLRHRPQPGTRRRGGHHRHPADAQRRANCAA
jgi:hypothetical protein